MLNCNSFSFRAFSSATVQAGQYDTRPASSFPMMHHAISMNHIGFLLMKSELPHTVRNFKVERQIRHRLQSVENNVVSDVYKEESSIIEEDDENCPVDCVREFKTDEEFLKFLAKAKKSDSLVVVDFFRNSCGSCKYIEQGFTKLCKGSGDQGAGIIFLKHNVIDEYDEQTEVAERLRIRSVPLFQFYKDGVLLEAFPTRDKERILAAIRKYTSVDF
ncbi:unnamed protein product [Spirodela intermedia]|uniref:Thioredoxin domain-containing protein n=1 Tax=Spirodela intermedia TaxID=51605 RepID=A0A7I8IQM2_SPIIN|nr:unnamed protein product [Spirodela intermedia]CAA6659432.1 unnamed protein product [Spirodela intermedia]